MTAGNIDNHKNDKNESGYNSTEVKKKVGRLFIDRENATTNGMGTTNMVPAHSQMREQAGALIW